MRHLLSFLFVTFLALTASAQNKSIAPSLAPQALHQRTDDLLQALMRELPAATQAALVGTYVAFDPDLSQPYAMIACDDDGDHVVVVTDAMIEFAQRIAEAKSADEHTGSKKLEAYAATLAAQTVRGVRLLPPPPGFYSGAHDPDREGELFDDAMRGVLAHELARLARRHLVCGHPTVAKESADEIWTPAERAFAWSLAPRLYDAQHFADAEASAAFVFRPGTKPRGAGYAALVDALAIIEAGPGAAQVPQIRLHPRAKPL